MMANNFFRGVVLGKFLAHSSKYLPSSNGYNRLGIRLSGRWLWSLGVLGNLCSSMEPEDLIGEDCDYQYMMTPWMWKRSLKMILLPFLIMEALMAGSLIEFELHLLTIWSLDLHCHIKNTWKSEFKKSEKKKEKRGGGAEKSPTSLVWMRILIYRYLFRFECFIPLTIN